MIAVLSPLVAVLLLADDGFRVVSMLLGVLLAGLDVSLPAAGVRGWNGDLGLGNGGIFTMIALWS